MKKITALLLCCCLLLSCVCANALTMEQALFSDLPQMLVRALDGFELLFKDEQGQQEIVFTQDENGQHVLLWNTHGEEELALSGLKLETVVEALLCYAAGVDSLPEGEAADLRFVAQIASAIGDAALRAVTVEEKRVVQADGSALQQTDIVLSPKKLLGEIDNAVQAQLLLNAEPIDHVLTRYAPILEKLLPEIRSVRSAADLSALWRSVDLSSLIPMELPIEMQFLSGASFWQMDAKAAGMSLQLVYSGGYLTATAATWGREYVFDSRDLDTLAAILIEAWNAMAGDACAFSASENSFHVHFDPSAFWREMETALLISLHEHAQDAQALLLKYLPFFGVEETDPDALMSGLYQLVHDFFYGLQISAVLPGIEAQATLGHDAFALSASLNGTAAHIRLNPNAVDVLIPTPAGLLKLNGVLNGKTFSLSGIAGEAEFSASGTYENGQWTIDLFADDAPLASIILTDSYVRIYEARTQALVFTLLWSDASLQMTEINGSSCTLLWDEDGISWTFNDIFHLFCSGRFSWEKALSFDMEIQQASYYRGQHIYDTQQLSLQLSEDAFSAEHQHRPFLSQKTTIHRAEIRWSGAEPYLLLSRRADPPFSWPRFSTYELEYRPGCLKGTFNNVSWMLSSATSAAGNSNDMQAVRTDFYGNVQRWDVHSAFDPNQCSVTITGENDVEITYWPETASFTQEAQTRLNVKMLSVHDLLTLLGLTQPVPTTTHTGSAQGFAGPVAVTVELDENNVITSILIGDENFCETSGFGAKARESAFQSQFLGRQLPLAADEIDGISGATITTNAVIAALNSIVAPAADAAEAAPEAQSALHSERKVKKAEAASSTAVRKGAAQGFAGPVAVRVELDENNIITAITIGDEKFCETPGFGARALEEPFQSQFIGKQLPLSVNEIDAISGATITTNAVIAALNSALE